MRTTTLYKSIKLVVSLYAAAFFHATTGVALAMDTVVEGVGLKKALEQPLVFSDSEFLLITASQSHADYSLTLTDKADQTVFRRVDIDSENILDEVLLVSARDCKECIISLDSKAEVDRHSPYRLEIQVIDANDRSTLETLARITDAGEAVYLAGTADEQNRKVSLQKASTLLVDASKTSIVAWRRHSLVCLSSVLFSLGKLDGYHDTLQTLLSETAGEITSYRASALFGLAQWSSDRPKVFKWLDEVLELAKQLESDFFRARALDAKGVILVLEADFDAAIDLISEAQAIYSRTSRWRYLMGPLHNLSWAYMRSGDLPASLAAASEQRLIAERYSFEEHALWAIYNFALAYGQSGDRAIAEGFLDEALTRIEKLPISDKTSSVTQLKAFLLLEKTQRALQYGALELADDYAILTEREFERLGQSGRVADVNFFQGGIAYSLQKFDLARRKFTETIEFDKRYDRKRSAGVHLLRLADLDIEQGRYIEASAAQSEAFEILSATQDYRSMAIAFRQAVYLLHKLGANEDADDLASRTSEFIYQHGLDKDRANLEYSRALIMHALGNRDQSLKHLGLTKSAIEKTLPKVQRRDLRRTFLALQKSVYEFNVRLLIDDDEGSAKSSLLLAETFKGRTLEESIRAIDTNQAVNADQLSKRSEILGKIQRNAVRWHSGQDNDNSESTVLAETRALSRDLEKLEVEIKLARDSAPASAKNTELAASLAQPTAKPSELIAYYFLGEEASWVWVIVGGDINVYPLPAKSDIERLANDAMKNMVVMPTLRKGASVWEQISAIEKLGLEILSPLAKHLDESDITHITIVPDGVLHALAFAPLSLPGRDEPLVSQYAISFVPSLAAKDAMSKRAHQREFNGSVKAIIVADPVGDGQNDLSLSRLEYSRQEAEYVSSLIKGDVVLLMAEDAGKQTFLEHTKQPFQIMHFATHGLLNDQEPSMSGLLFSGGADSGNRLWLAPEISNSDISTDLVVLSACDSSVGKYLAGEGLFSLSRAFIEGGASQVLGTLWKVEDVATAQLMKHFYSYLVNENVSVAEALGRAQDAIYRDKENDWKDPYFWAGFQLQGTGVDQLYASSK